MNNNLQQTKGVPMKLLDEKIKQIKISQRSQHSDIKEVLTEMNFVIQELQRSIQLLQVGTHHPIKYDKALQNVKTANDIILPESELTAMEKAEQIKQKYATKGADNNE